MQYIAMDNAPFHKPKDDINELIKRSIRLPPYCPELKSIEHLWAIFKSKVKQSKAKSIWRCRGLEHKNK